MSGERIAVQIGLSSSECSVNYMVCDCFCLASSDWDQTSEV